MKSSHGAGGPRQPFVVLAALAFEGAVPHSLRVWVLGDSLGRLYRRRALVCERLLHREPDLSAAHCNVTVERSPVC
jgi:hypothetical protein